MNPVSMRNVKFTYRGAARPALERVSLEAEAGERLVLIGLTGAGKSTLLRCTNRLVPASFRGEFEGTVKILSRDVSGKRPAQLAGKVGMVFQDFESQLFSTTAELDVAFGPENLGLARQEVKERVDEALNAVGMEELRHRDPATLSGGQKQRLAIAAVLALRPLVLCLDEPVTDLDPEGREEVAKLVAGVCDSGATVIMAEHEPELMANADRIIGLEAGKIAADRPAPEMLTEPGALQSLGVRPPDTTRTLDKLGLTSAGHSVKAAAERIRSAGFAVRPDFKKLAEDKDGKAREKQGATLLEVQDIHHRYENGAEALAGVGLAIRRGEFMAVLGRNGSGKTTLVKHLNGLLRPTRGAVMIEGKDAAGMKTSELGRRIGFVFQDPDHQIFESRVIDEVSFAPKNYGFGPEEAAERSRRALELVGLSGYEDRDPFLLTKGERQRVALASVLSAGPDVLIFDEPTTGLDYPAQRAVMEILAGLNHDGATVIIITHSLWTVAEYARRCVVMDRGRVLGDGPTRDILSDGPLLERAGLRSPEVTRLGLELGFPALSAAELAASLERRA